MLITLIAFIHYPHSAAPRLYNNCEQKWIGTEYNLRLARHPTCQRIWSELTREALLDAPNYP